MESNYLRPTKIRLAATFPITLAIILSTGNCLWDRRLQPPSQQLKLKAENITMVTIPNTDFKSNVRLANILYCKTKDSMQKIANRLDLYVSPNIAKEKMATRLAGEMLANPIEIVSRLTKTDLLLLEEFLSADKDTYIIKKARKSEYMLQKWCLVLTYEDETNGKWHLLMPDEVYDSLKEVAFSYIEMAKAGQKGPSSKELRLRSFMTDLLGHSDFTIQGNMVINHRAKDSD